MNWWSVLKTYTDETGKPMGPSSMDPMDAKGAAHALQIEDNTAAAGQALRNLMGRQNQPQPPEQEESKPLYDQKQQLGIAHYLLEDIQQIAQLLRELHDDGGSADWERLLFDVERIKQILEDALTGGGPKPSGGGM